MDESTLDAIVQRAEAGEQELANATKADFEAWKASFVGPRGSFTEARKQLAQLPKEERPAFGKRLNEVKGRLDAVFGRILAQIEEGERTQALGPRPDGTLPPVGWERGAHHLVQQVREEICAILSRVGFVVAEGTEVETEFFCFDALNTPADHPARDLQDTYYLREDALFGNVSKRDQERYLLRAHTSTVQIRTMLRQSPPLRIVSPGRCFRRDTADATHGANFHQIEGLYVDRKVTVRDLKAILDYLFRSLLGSDAEIRFRPHFFPYTEPSFEVDLRSRHLSKVGKDWMEIMGCGMVDPAVFEAVGYDSEVWSGYAFGLGIERIAMSLYGVDDIRYFYQNDLRFLRQFA